MATLESSAGDPSKSAGTVEDVPSSKASLLPDLDDSPTNNDDKSWFSRNGKFVIGGALLFFIVLVATALFVYFFLIKNDVSEGYRLASEYLNAAINQSADPCVDFAQFACGQWVAKHPIPDDKTAMNPYQALQDLEAERLRDLYSVVGEKHKSEAVNTMRQTYNMCMTEDSWNLLTVRTEIQFNKYWNWPPVERRKEYRYGYYPFDDAFIDTLRAGVFPFHRFSVAVDPKNTSRHVLQIDQPETLLPPEYYRDPKKYAAEIAATKEYVLKKLALLGTVDDSPYNFEAEALDIMEFDEKLASILALKSERRDPFKLYHPMTWGEFRNMTQTTQRSRQNLLNFLEKFPTNVGMISFNYNFILRFAISREFGRLLDDDDLPIVSTGVDYLKKIYALIDNDIKAAVNYAVYRYYDSFDTIFLGEKFDSLYAEYRKKMYGEQKLEPRWRRCVRIISKQFSHASSLIWAEKYLDQTTGQVTDSMIADLKAAFKEMLNNVHWMTEATKKRAHRKLDEMIATIGAIRPADNITQFDESHWMPPYDPKYSYLKNHWFYNTIVRERQFKKLLEKPDRHESTDTTSTVSPHYYPEHNSIGLSTGSLQVPFFHPTFPKSMNYGAVGSLIGHEITHGFDNNGCNYDYDGTLENWCDKESRDGFDASSKCIAKQYGDITVPEINLKLNGENSSGEDAADNGGIKASYAAYQKFVSKNGAEPAVPGLKYSHEQLFFLAYAQNWCETIKPDALRDLVSTGKHTPGKYRTNVVLQNTREFASAFNCPSGSAMNPTNEKRCELW